MKAIMLALGEAKVIMAAQYLLSAVRGIMDGLKELKSVDNRYIFEKKLGKGANGSVYLVYDEKLGKRWALKLMANRSETELTALKKVSHPAFPRIVDSGYCGEGAFIVMDYVEGKALSEYLNGRKCNEKERLGLSLQLAEALRSLHNSNPSMLYLDCKPDNIIVTSKGELKLVDLGSIYLKDMVNPGRISGTAGYAAPEQRAGRSVGITSDVYAYGQTIRRIISDSKDERLKSIIRRCIMPNPKDRYQSMNEIIYELGSRNYLFIIKNISGYVLNAVFKSVIAGFTILSFKNFSEEGTILYLILGFLLMLLLVSSLKGGRDRVTMKWNCVQDIHMGRGCKLLGIILLFCMVILGNRAQSYADELYRVTFYDAAGYKILYKGQKITINEDMSVSISIPTENVTPDTIPVRAEWELK